MKRLIRHRPSRSAMAGNMYPLLCVGTALVVFAALPLFGDALGADTGKREAYVSLLYGNFYVLPLRTMMRSLKDNSIDVKSGQRERVVLVTGSTSEGTVAQLQSDGITVMRISTVRTPYADDPRFDKRFGDVMTKLAIFNLTQYDRVVFVDADALFRRDMSDIFACGRFCAVFINPCHFNSGLMLVTPSAETFDDMLRMLPKLPSYDGGDQGFLNAYYPQMLNAPIYDPLATDRDMSELDFVRLPFVYHMDHSAYYPRMRWDHSETRCGGAMREEEWLGPSFAKPWLWYTYFVLDQSWVWHEYRSKLEKPYPEGTRTGRSAAVLIALCYAIFLPLLGFGHRLHYTVGTLLPRVAFPFAAVARRYSLLTVLAFGWCLWALSIMLSALLVPPLISPVLAFSTLAHLRATSMLVFFVFPFGAVACCGQRRARGIAKSTTRVEIASKSAPTLRRVITECAAWTITDSVFVLAADYVMWQIQFDTLTQRIRFIGLAAVLQVLLTSAMLLRAGMAWLSLAGTLPQM
jgi:hypothetical protein